MFFLIYNNDGVQLGMAVGDGFESKLQFLKQILKSSTIRNKILDRYFQPWKWPLFKEYIIYLKSVIKSWNQNVAKTLKNRIKSL